MSISLADALRIGDLDAHDQASLARRGDVSRRELGEAALLRIGAVDPDVNAVTYAVAATDLRDPVGQGDLVGVPYLLKASLEYPGWPMTSCSRARRQAGGKTAYPFVRSLDAAGLVPVGMSAMPEFGLLTSGEPILTGAVRNPWAAERSAGGSSTGAAAAVAAGLVPLAHASDAAGSIRVPAACCGVVGLKSSRGANRRARAPHLIDDLLCCDGLIARSVRDAAWSFETTLDEAASIFPASPVRGLRVALCLTGLDGRMPDPKVAGALEHVALVCEAVGCTVDLVPTLAVDGEAIIAAFQTIWVHEGGEIVDLIGASVPAVPLDELLEPWTIGLAERRQALRLADTGAAFGQVAQSGTALQGFFERYDILLSPVTATPPPPIGELAPTRDFDALWTQFWRYTNYTPLANIAGVPSIGIPGGFAEMLPIGAMLTAAVGHDRTLLALARALEEALPWHDRWPAKSAHALVAIG